MNEDPPTLSRRSFLLNTTAAAALTAFSLNSFAQIGGAPTPAVAATASTIPQGPKLVLGMVVFEGFQLLDTFGPLEMFGALRDKVLIQMIGEHAGSVKSSAGPAVVIDRTFADAGKIDIVMIPGGGGTRREVNSAPFVAALKSLAESATHVASICTGSAVLARTGLLDGLKATTNKRAYKWATGQSDRVLWVPEARWVEDGKYFTSSGISAGMDMTLGLIAKLYGRDTAIRIANGAEYEWNSDAHRDPFAKLNGLVN